MDSNLQPPSGNKLVLFWFWLTGSSTRMLGLILLTLGFILLMVLILIMSQRSVEPKVDINLPEPSPVVPVSPNDISSLTSSESSDTANWNNLINDNGFTFKYPKEATFSGYTLTATSSAAVQVNIGESVLGIETLDKISSLSLETVVELVRQKNASSSATQKILTKPISILFAGNKGYEWYLESSKFYGNYTNFTSRPGKNRVVQFKKGDKSYIIFTTFDGGGDQLLSTFRLSQ